MGPDIALAASARDWPDRLHRYLLDHGGGRVVAHVMGADQALAERYDVFLVDDICSFLTPRLVTEIKSGGSDVIGVFSPGDGPDAKRRLLECGISDVIDTGAAPHEFLEKISATLSHRVRVEKTNLEGRARGTSIGVTGAAAGVGITELSVGLASSLSDQLGVVCLVDLDPRLPSIAQRLGLPLHPNIRTAIDRVMHASGRVEDAMQWLGDIAVIGGVADGGRGSPLSHVEASMLLDSLFPPAEAVVVDLGPLGTETPGAMRTLDVVVVVGAADPIGIARLLRTVHGILEAPRTTPILVVANMTPRSPFHESEVRLELARAFPDLPSAALPFDRKLARLSWDGGLARRGPFSKAVGRLAAVIAEGVADER